MYLFLAERKEFMDKLRNELWMPDEEDYRGAVTSLIRLEDTYLLTPKDIRNGEFGKSKAMRKLNGNTQKVYISEFETFG